MSDTTTTPAAPAATPQVPPAPAPAAPPAPAPEPPKSLRPIDDPLLAPMLRSMGRLVEDPVIKKVEDPPAAPAPAPAAPPASGTPPTSDSTPAAPPTPPKPKGSVRRPDLTRQDVVDAVRDAMAPPEPPAPAPAAPTVDPDEEYLKQLEPEQVEEIEIARFAETADPEKYKGMSKKLIEFFKKVDNYAAEAGKKDPDRTFSADDEEFQEFVKANRPGFSPIEIRRMERAMIEHRATERANKAIDERAKSLELKTKELELKPQFDRQLDTFEKSVLKMGEEEHAKLLRDKGFDEAIKEFPLETNVYRQAIDQSAAHAREYLNLANGLKPFEPNNPMHKWILKFVQEQGAHFEKHGGDDRVRDGKTFMTREKFAEAMKKNPHEAEEKYWTLSHDDVLSILAWNAKVDAEHRIKHLTEQAEKNGFSRVKKTPAVTPQKPPDQPPQPSSGPSVRSTPAPGPVPATPVTDPNHPGHQVIQTLGLRNY